jgi:hypothetical protein
MQVRKIGSIHPAIAPVAQMAVRIEKTSVRLNSISNKCSTDWSNAISRVKMPIQNRAIAIAQPNNPLDIDAPVRIHAEPNVRDNNPAQTGKPVSMQPRTAAIAKMNIGIAIVESIPILHIPALAPSAKLDYGENVSNKILLILVGYGLVQM